MVELQANPDFESLKIWLGATVAVMAVLVAVVGYFLSKRDEAVSAAIKNLNETVRLNSSPQPTRAVQYR